MTKETRLKRSLPLCMAAMICDKVIIGNDNVPSFIRVVDNIKYGSRANKFKGMVQLAQVNLVVIFKKDQSHGEFKFQLICVGPTERTAIGEAELVFAEEGPEYGRLCAMPVAVKWEGDGLYWLVIEIDGITVGKTPLRIITPEAEKKKKSLKKTKAIK